MVTLVTKNDWEVVKSENTKETGKTLFVIFGKGLSSELVNAIDKFDQEEENDVVLRVVDEQTDADVTTELLALLEKEDETNMILVLKEGKKVDATAFISEDVLGAFIQKFK